MASKPLPFTAGAGGEAAAAAAAAAAGGGGAVPQEQLASCIAHFLRICPGLNKTTIGELLGDPDPFYLQVRVVADGWALMEGDGRCKRVRQGMEEDRNMVLSLPSPVPT
jgi:hypothetical protein